MARDPAFLFYPGDWQGGTSTYGRHLKGAYMDLLIAQFNNGPLSLEEIKTVLGSDFGPAWPTLQKKFKAENGLFFNVRLESEKLKRIQFTKSRSDNRKGKNSSYDKSHDEHMNNHMEDENKNRVKNRKKKGAGKKEPGLVLPFDSEEFKTAWENLLQSKKWVKKSDLALNASLKKLAAENEQDAIKMIENSIAGEWQGLFPLKPEEKSAINQNSVERKLTALQNVQNQYND